MNVSLFNQQLLAIPMVPTVHITCFNAKTTSASMHLGYVMVIMTVVMILMKNFICAVRGKEMEWLGMVLFGK